MPNNLARYCSLFVLCVLATGCFPYHYTTRMGVSGTVIDADTHAPLAGARVSWLCQTNETTIAISATDGSFVVPPRKKWGIWIIPQDYFGWRWLGGTACIRHVGYETNLMEISSVEGTERRFRIKADLGTIPLKPSAQ